MDNLINSCAKNDKLGFEKALGLLSFEQVHEKNIEFYFKKLSLSSLRTRTKSELQELIDNTNNLVKKETEIAKEGRRL